MKAVKTGTDQVHQVARGEAHLKVRDLTVHATAGGASRTLVQDVSFRLRPGETLGIVGESGSGKSMTAKALVGLLPPGVRAGGNATFGGEQLVGRPERELRRLRGSQISLLLQDPFTMLNPLQTAARHIDESLASDRRLSRAERAREVRRRLAEVGIEDADAAHRYPFQLSGGMQQRVALAAALAKNPSLLIADEPTTALDASIQHDVLLLLRQIQRDRNMGLILITHDLRVALSVCDRIMVMYAGTVIEDGPSPAVKAAPQHPYSLGLLRAEPPLTHARAHLSSIPGNVPSADTVKNICGFSPRCDWATPECRAGKPLLAVVESDHRSACRRIDDIRPGLRERQTSDDAAVPPAPPASLDSPILSVHQLRKVYRVEGMVGPARTHEALAGVSFEIGVGESVGLVGESGSGKTTIARCLLGLNRPTEGNIHLDGIDITDYRKLKPSDLRKVRHLVQCVFQNPYASLNPARTVGATLREAVNVRGHAVDLSVEVDRMLELVGLPRAYSSRRPALLSGGERQRVAIARALAIRPRLLICDEPVAGLDVSVQAQVLELLRQLRRELSMNMLFISHDLAVVRQITDRVVVLHRGEIVEQGVTGEVFADPQHPYTKRLVQAVPRA
ncbi:ABC transporter ATP-binding protein [Kribbella sancticallisti]|uniref:ABC transporter ATP-binding protein n=1 Tax=Kribbella sancticallisti TaxID=460087 RepID=A0ABP4NEI6_9ACTN